MALDGLGYTFYKLSVAVNTIRRSYGYTDETEVERIANLEGQVAHLATKADIENLHTKLSTMNWIIGIAIPATIAIIGVVVQVLNNLPG